jgi:hypothetical protein
MQRENVDGFEFADLGLLGPLQDQGPGGYL